MPQPGLFTTSLLRRGEEVDQPSAYILDRLDLIVRLLRPFREKKPIPCLQSCGQPVYIELGIYLVCWQMNELYSPVSHLSFCQQQVTIPVLFYSLPVVGTSSPTSTLLSSSKDSKPNNPTKYSQEIIFLYLSNQECRSV